MLALIDVQIRNILICIEGEPVRCRKPMRQYWEQCEQPTVNINKCTRSGFNWILKVFIIVYLLLWSRESQIYTEDTTQKQLCCLVLLVICEFNVGKSWSSRLQETRFIYITRKYRVLSISKTTSWTTRNLCYYLWWYQRFFGVSFQETIETNRERRHFWILHKK